MCTQFYARDCCLEDGGTEVLAALATLPNLTIVDAAYNDLEESSLEPLMKLLSHTSLKQLELNGNEELMMNDDGELTGEFTAFQKACQDKGVMMCYESDEDED